MSRVGVTQFIKGTLPFVVGPTHILSDVLQITELKN